MARKKLTLRDVVKNAYEEINEKREEEIETIEEVLADDNSEIEEKEAAREEPVAEVETDNEPEKDELDDEPRAIANWSEEDKKIFKSLDTKGREFLLKRHNELEKDYTKKRQADAEALKLANSYKRILNEHGEHFKKLGMEPDQAIDMLAKAEKKLRFGTTQEKLDTFNYLARNYDVLKESAANQQQEVDPKLQPILQKVSQQEAYLVRLERERQQQERDYYEHTINTFKNTKDGKGNLKYPDFDVVRTQMGKLMSLGEVASLEEAYESAILLNKELREKYISGYTTQSKRLEEEQRRAAASKKASFNVRSRSSAESAEPRKKESLRQTLAKIYDAQQQQRI